VGWDWVRGMGEKNKKAKGKWMREVSMRMETCNMQKEGHCINLSK
jgi:hypothetical protein